MTVADIESRLTAIEEEVASLREQLETDRVREGIRKAREQVAAGKVVPAREFLELMRKKHKIARR